MNSLIIWFIAIIVLFNMCRSSQSGRIKEEIWGETDGKEVRLFTLTNSKGMVIKVSNYGATLTYVSTPDRDGIFDPVVLGFDSFNNYLSRHPNFGSTIGRYANRIRGAEFTLYGVVYRLTANSRGNSIHGGEKGFSKQVFKVDTAYSTSDSSIVVFSYLSHDKEEGFPGTLQFKLRYALTDDNKIILDYRAVTDKPTVVNFTNHSYFNLTGCRESVLGHILMIAADSVCPVDTNGIPTGEILHVRETPYDFTQGARLGDMITGTKRGFDINYVLLKEGIELSLAAEAYDPVSGRVLKAYTTEPGMQFYSANSDLSRFTGHNGIGYGKNYGICLEMQHYPDSPNNPHFPDVVLEPDEQYRQLTVYEFSVRKD